LLSAGLVVLFLTCGAALFRGASSVARNVPNFIKASGRNLAKNIDPSLLQPALKNRHQNVRKCFDNIPWDNLAEHILQDENNFVDLRKFKAPTYRFDYPEYIVPLPDLKPIKIGSKTIAFQNNLGGYSFYLAKTGEPFAFSAYNRHTGTYDLFDFLGLPYQLEK